MPEICTETQQSLMEKGQVMGGSTIVIPPRSSASVIRHLCIVSQMHLLIFTSKCLRHKNKHSAVGRIGRNMQEECHEALQNRWAEFVFLAGTVGYEPP